MLLVHTTAQLPQVQSTAQQSRYSTRPHCTGFVSGGIIRLEYTQCILFAHVATYKLQSKHNVSCPAALFCVQSDLMPRETIFTSFYE